MLGFDRLARIPEIGLIAKRSVRKNVFFVCLVFFYEQ